MTSYDDLDDELQRLKEAMLHPGNLPDSSTCKESLKLGTQSLQESIKILESFCSDFRSKRQVSMSKATASHDKAQAALIDQDMASVFQHSIDKQVHIRLVQALKVRIEEVEATKVSLEKRLAKLETLLKYF